MEKTQAKVKLDFSSVLNYDGGKTLPAQLQFITFLMFNIQKIGNMSKRTFDSD